MKTIREKELEVENKMLLENVRRLLDESQEQFKEIQTLKRELRKAQFTTITTENFEIKLHRDRESGTFEHLTRGEEVGGTLIFKNDFNGDDVLVDYDGVYMLPEEVKEVLSSEGYLVRD